MVKNFIILALSLFSWHRPGPVGMSVRFLMIFLLFFGGNSLNAQDMLLTIVGREIPCLIDKVDSSFVTFTPLGQLKVIDKTLINKITPRKLILLDGSEKNVVFDIAAYDVKGPYVYYREIEKTKKRTSRYNYFSCYYNSFDTLLPFQDTLLIKKMEEVLYVQLDSTKKKFELTVDQQRAYTYGCRSARKNFISPWSTMGGVATGLTGGLMLSPFYAAAPAIIYAAINSAISPPLGQTSPQDKDYLANDYFLEGYTDEARVIKAKNSLLGAVPSLIFGILINYFRSN